MVLEKSIWETLSSGNRHWWKCLSGSCEVNSFQMSSCLNMKEHIPCYSLDFYPNIVTHTHFHSVYQMDPLSVTQMWGVQPTHSPYQGSQSGNQASLSPMKPEAWPFLIQTNNFVGQKSEGHCCAPDPCWPEATLFPLVPVCEVLFPLLLASFLGVCLSSSQNVSLWKDVECLSVTPHSLLKLPPLGMMHF